MAEYIERGAAMAAILNVPDGNWKSERYANEIEKIDPADVEPVRHGTWIHDGPNFHGGVDWCHCSECHSLEVWAAKTPYCAHCGAEMQNGKR